MQKKSLKTKEYAFTAIYEGVKKGGYQVVVPLLPGLITYGRTFEEAQKMVRDAIRCHLEGIRKEKGEIPYEPSLLQERVAVTLSR